MSLTLDEVVRAQKRSESRGIASICSAHPWVLKTALKDRGPLLIESTSAQVNQFGGYTGMTPADFASFVHQLAVEEGFPADQLILGGDHLGPNPWRDQPAETAMARAEGLVRDCVVAGYTKIHLDASMYLGGDDATEPLNPEVAAQRTVRMARAAEKAAARQSLPLYVIGTEVPPPGGAVEAEKSIHVTRVEDVNETLEVMEAAFRSASLESAWERVIAIVVQPGVEFGSDFIFDYQPAAAQNLSHFIETTPFIYEAHSTDYQTMEALGNLVRDHFAILKVGPALTFAFREAVFSLSAIEDELIEPESRSRIRKALEEAMLRKPAYWNDHYRGSELEQAFARMYSWSDRIRYYWPEPSVQAALKRLLANLRGLTMPLSLLSQFAPNVFDQIRAGALSNCPESVIQAAIQQVLKTYMAACQSPFK